MDRKMQMMHLAEAERHVAQAERHILEQEQRSLTWTRTDTTPCWRAVYCRTSATYNCSTSGTATIFCASWSSRTPLHEVAEVPA